ncbi:hypothetical protein [Hyperthermus butylicus]|uniref:Uncharacterized protein n=1 Tax=Hyperthermus butylicus (strain DSM 5456 / JCM 9403 / PLM1-5) TaxID=415426 RepID=A2BLP1_HYPBU|nr:hypothetical protein [Hyperthermus butylicus]ABM80902.1 hypothetical protein Hbut_1059 [Hyperthermus butylicus DSM 5456]
MVVHEKLGSIMALLLVVAVLVPVAAPLLQPAEAQTPVEDAAKLASLRGKIVACSFMVRSGLERLGLLSATADEIAAKLNISANDAELILKIASLGPASLANMSLEELKELAGQAHQACKLLSGAVSRIAAVKAEKIRERIMERAAEKLQLTVSVLAKVLGEDAVDQDELQELRKALAEGNMAKARMLLRELTLKLRAAKILALNVQLKKMLAAGLKANNTVAPRVVAEKLAKAMEKLEHLAEVIGARARHLNMSHVADIIDELRIRLREDIGFLNAKILGKMMIGHANIAANETVRKEALLAWLSTLKTRITVLRAEAEAIHEKVRDNANALALVERALEALDRAEELVGKAYDALSRNEFHSAISYAVEAERHIATATALLARTRGLIGPGLAAGNVTASIDTTVVLEKLGVMLDRLAVAVSALSDAVMQTNTTEVLKLYEKLVQTVDEAKKLYEEALEAAAAGNLTALKTIEAMLHEAIIEAMQLRVELETKLSLHLHKLGEAPGVGELMRMVANATRTLMELQMKIMRAKMYGADSRLLGSAEELVEKALGLLEEARKALYEGNVAKALELMKKVGQLYDEASKLLEEALASVGKQGGGRGKP